VARCDDVARGEGRAGRDEWKMEGRSRDAMCHKGRNVMCQSLRRGMWRNLRWREVFRERKETAFSSLGAGYGQSMKTFRVSSIVFFVKYVGTYQSHMIRFQQFKVIPHYTVLLNAQISENTLHDFITLATEKSVVQFSIVTQQ